MNFSKKEAANKQRRLKSASAKLKTKALISLFRIFLVSIVLLAFVGVASGYGVIKGLIDDAPNIDAIDVAPTGFSTTIYDQDGNELIKLAGSQANRIYADIDKIPKNLQNAFIAIEDERFYKHNGIDVRGIFRAFFVGISSGDFSEGASTLTQQLLKNQVFEGGNETGFISRFERKVQEQYLAVQLENKLTKKQILEYYLNTINLGQNTLGVQAASLRYFNKDVSDITLSEAAVIAGITQSPVYLNPITHPKANAKRRSEILNNMLEQKLISQANYDKAVQDDEVYDRIQTVNKEQSDSSVYSYFVDELINQVINDLQTKKGYSYTQATNALYRGGLSIYTTQDSAIQKICDSVFQDPSYFPSNSKWELSYRLSILKKNGKTVNYSEGHVRNYFSQKHQTMPELFSQKGDVKPYIQEFKSSVVEDGDEITGEKVTMTIEPQASFVVMDQATGQVKAIIGGRGQKEGNLTLNRASTTTRQPGSTFKILSTYLPALDTGGMTLASVFDDSPFKYPNGRPVNNWNHSYNGLTTLRQAIYNSMNIVTVKTLEKVTPQVGFEYLSKLGFSTLVENEVDDNGKVFSDIGLPMALGGLTKGVTNLELTGAFASIANDGIYTTPTFYTKILDHNNKVLINNKPKTRQVMKESTSWLLTNAMEDVVKKGTGTRVRFQNISMPIAGKTGTTSDENDLWFSGFTPYYTATIWTGYDNNGSLTDTTYHKVIWRTIMEKVNAKLQTKSFKMPDSIVSAKICTKSGKLAIDGVCNEAQGGSTVRTEYFAKGTVPTEKCDVHIKLSICKESGKIANEYCPKSSVSDKVYLIKEKESGHTADTPYILPENLQDSTCNVHNSKNRGSSGEFITPPSKASPSPTPSTTPKEPTVPIVTTPPVVIPTPTQTPENEPTMGSDN
ncbi:transglycosylase domain-containing protein [Anaeromicropila herbilytica]|uniref:Penicillin-binding protein 1A n=1 Tax=Anaeromicropila herbilytica TaxID=2785025 RepID=A0A7R7IDI2_9FIRM|nr:PBP1A family penicillin-binding protein [Anaeromicropila herbilytica]BCN30038.1 penicillin-binding protein 1A [Anaeromicropila herbilytica]